MLNAENKMNEKIKIGIATLVALGGGLVAGTQVNKPACDYVIESAQEICLSESQARALLDSMATSTTQFGFDGVQFSEPLLLKK